jgi:hypothetical protein
LFPINQGQRELELYDPKTKETTTIDTCFTWGHVNFDDKGVLWSSFGPAAGKAPSSRTNPVASAAGIVSPWKSTGETPGPAGRVPRDWEQRLN